MLNLEVRNYNKKVKNYLYYKILKENYRFGRGDCIERGQMLNFINPPEKIEFPMNF